MVQTELDQFFANLCHRANSIRRVSAQAFFSGPYKIGEEVLIPLNQQLMAWVGKHLPFAFWWGWRIFAAIDLRARMNSG